MAFFEKLKPQEESEEETQETTPSKPKKIVVKNESGKESLQNKKDSQDNDSWFQPEGELTVDVYETEQDIVIQTAIAGISPEELSVSVENDIVTISGERNNETTDEGKNYFYQECFWGSFSRQIILPQEVDPNRAQASMKNGVLTLRIPKLNRQKVKKIKVKG